MSERDDLAEKLFEALPMEHDAFRLYLLRP
jgi:hypothetical protein